jgi:hypothetical protein
VTPQEQQLLTNLTQKINQTELREKDPDAENLLGHELGANPDALYILAQTVLVQNIALEQARGQVAQLQQQVQQLQQSRPQQPAHATSFLGRLLGDRDPQPAPPPQQAPPYQPVPQYTQPAPPPYAPPTQYQQPQYVQQPQYAPPQSGGSSFLRSAATTAAGVAAGALAFEGVESILHGFGHGGGYGMGGMGMGSGMGMGGGFERPVEETVINNYYDEPGQGGERHFEQAGGEHRFHETADQGGAQFSDASYNTSGESSRDDQMAYNDSDSVNSSSDDASGFDDGSQNDGGSGFDDGGGFDNSSNDLL